MWSKFRKYLESLRRDNDIYHLRIPIKFPYQDIQTLDKPDNMPEEVWELAKQDIMYALRSRKIGIVKWRSDTGTVDIEFEENEYDIRD